MSTTINGSSLLAQVYANQSQSDPLLNASIDPTLTQSSQADALTGIGLTDPMLNAQPKTAVTDPVTLSGSGQMLSTLQNLQTTDPTEFTKVLTSLAQTLQSQAASATGSEADKLNTLAGQVNAAATTGDLSSLLPSSSTTSSSPYGSTSTPANTAATINQMVLAAFNNTSF